MPTFQVRCAALRGTWVWVVVCSPLPQLHAAQPTTPTRLFFRGVTSEWWPELDSTPRSTSGGGVRGGCVISECWADLKKAAQARAHTPVPQATWALTCKGNTLASRFSVAQGQASALCKPAHKPVNWLRLEGDERAAGQPV